MRIQSCIAINFGSFKNLDFNFDSVGLALLSGHTGVGKSTIVDTCAWCLFGIDSKGGAADSVKTWGCDEPTKVILDVESPAGAIVVVRVRGKASQNDLYWEEAGEIHRGKDMIDTQKLLEQRLGIDAETFSLTAYFSQFSDSDRFFVMKAKERREILEKICDLTLPISLGEKSSEARKVTKKELDALESELTRLTGAQEQLERQKASAEAANTNWETQHEKEIKEVKKQAEGFEAARAKQYNSVLETIRSLDSRIKPDVEFSESLDSIRNARKRVDDSKAGHRKLQLEVSDLNARISAAERDKARFEKAPKICPTCLGEANNANSKAHIQECANAIKDLTKESLSKTKELDVLGVILNEEKALNRKYDEVREAQAKNKELNVRLNAAAKELENLDGQVNVYEDRLTVLTSAKNPYSLQIFETKKAINDSREKCSALQTDVNKKAERVTALTTLYDLSFTLRGELLRNSVKGLERGCNRILEKYFDGAFRCGFSLNEDKLEVEIHKDDHSVPFKSLSGGQRRMLVISLFVSLRRLALDKAGVELNLLACDEIFNGLSDDFKVKAFALFEELSQDTESIILIDHSEELKAQFARRFEVTLQNDESVITDVTAT